MEWISATVDASTLPATITAAAPFQERHDLSGKPVPNIPDHA
jgi:hypothetical protein